jgi:hypothetical protein
VIEETPVVEETAVVETPVVEKTAPAVEEPAAPAAGESEEGA